VHRSELLIAVTFCLIINYTYIIINFTIFNVLLLVNIAQILILLDVQINSLLLISSILSTQNRRIFIAFSCDKSSLRSKMTETIQLIKIFPVKTNFELYKKKQEINLYI
jgi:hypothetical protein